MSYSAERGRRWHPALARSPRELDGLVPDQACLPRSACQKPTSAASECAAIPTWPCCTLRAVGAAPHVPDAEIRPLKIGSARRMVDGPGGACVGFSATAEG